MVVSEVDARIQNFTIEYKIVTYYFPSLSRIFPLLVERKPLQVPIALMRWPSPDPNRTIGYFGANLARDSSDRTVDYL